FIARWTRIPHSTGRLSASASSHHSLSSAAFITNIAESDFRHAQVGRPTMRFVPVKTADQQAAVLLHRGRERLVRQRTGLVNALRGHLAEFGVIAPQGLRNVDKLIAIIRDNGDTRLPDVARQVLQVLANQIDQIEAAVAGLERQLLAWHKTNAVSQRLASIPGIGPIIATALATTVADPNVFHSGR